MFLTQYRYLNGRKLQSWLNICIITLPKGKHVKLVSMIHVDKICKVPFSYSLDFTDQQILSDFNLVKFVKERYGDVYAAGE